MLLKSLIQFWWVYAIAWLVLGNGFLVVIGLAILGGLCGF